MRLGKMFNQTLQHFIDIFILSVSFVIAYYLRFDFKIGIPELRILLFQLPYVVLLGMVSYYFQGIYKLVWRYTSLREVRLLVIAHGSVGAILLVIRLGLPVNYHHAMVPISIIIINGIIALGCSVGVRALYRIYFEWTERNFREKSRSPEKIQRVLLVGAGRAGDITARELEGRVDLGLKPVGFVDDDPVKQGLVIRGLKVLGPTDAIPSISKSLQVDLLLITIASISGPKMRRIKEICDKTKLPIKVLPGLYELIDGTVSVNRIRDVDIEDLLGREAVHLDQNSISTFIKGRAVLVTGAGGSIGSEMCRQICKFAPAKILLVERAENALFEIHRELIAQEHGFEITPLIADICDSGRLANIFSTFSPQVVIHAAAHKHVPMMEWNPGEAIKNNIFGTKILADASVAFGVERFIMISTDKAVNPTSIMGTTKRIAEMYLQTLSFGASSLWQGTGAGDANRTKFITVRFGNVLGSAGSVIPIFKGQIKNGGPITVTHPEMTRYFMTIPEASQLVLQAAAMGNGGEVFVLDMGNPVKIVDLARDLVRLSGLDEGEIEIVFTGLRPGEKLFEEICLSCEGFEKTRHPKIFTGRLSLVERSVMESSLERLRSYSDGKSNEDIATVFKEIVPEFREAITGKNELLK